MVIENPVKFNSLAAVPRVTGQNAKLLRNAKGYD